MTPNLVKGYEKTNGNGRNEYEIYFSFIYNVVCDKSEFCGDDEILFFIEG